jgi:hypothetical protein
MGANKMSAVFDALRQDAVRREGAGFTTIQAQPVEYLSGKDPRVTTTSTSVGAAVSGRAIFISYSATMGLPEEFDLRGATLAQSEMIFVPTQKETSTMGTGSILFVNFGNNLRGVVALDLPRKRIHSEDVTFYTAKLKRKMPTTIIGGRDYGEENA